jgi:hypothetical protein
LSRAKAPVVESKKDKKKRLKDQKRKNMIMANGIKRDYSSNEALLKHSDSPDSLQNPVTVVVSQPDHLVTVEEDVSIQS